MYILAGLGNPGEQYEKTRHNTGRMAAGFIADNWSDDAPKIKFFTPESYMNKSGQALAKLVKSKKAAEKLIVIYDDLDLPLGTLKISYNRSSGGHRGVESIIKALKTEAFIRIRIGISPATPGGKLKKPKGEREVEKFILGEFKPRELDILKKVFKRAEEAVETISEHSLERAMSEFNK